MQRRLMSRFAFATLVAFLALPVHAQNFSCRIGTQPTCLDFGDKVCSSLGKCVSDTSACFDKYQCNYEGFTCKSNVTQCVEEHDVLVRKYNSLLSDNNELVDDYNALLSRNSALVDKYNALLSDYEELLSTAQKTAKAHEGLNDCLSYASTMDDVQSCVDYQ